MRKVIPLALAALVAASSVQAQTQTQPPSRNRLFASDHIARLLVGAGVCGLNEIKVSVVIRAVLEKYPLSRPEAETIADDIRARAYAIMTDLESGHTSCSKIDALAVSYGIYGRT
jgi:hypothetical protein